MPAPIGHGAVTSESRTVTLTDGTHAVLRPLSSQDVDAVLDLADSLSGQEKYFRFFTAHPRHAPQWADSVTASGGGGVALGAYDHGELVGVANYAVLQDPGRAEVGVVVAHDQHDRGIGTALLNALVDIARRDGQHHLVADVLAENHAMRKVIDDAHVPVTWHRDGSVLDVDVDLDAPTET